MSAEDSTVPAAPAPEVPPEVPDAAPTVVLSEIDSFIRERQKGQPKTLEEVRAEVVTTDPSQSRLQLPPELEGYSYDCTRGGRCEAHRRDLNTGKLGHRGEFIFRWLWKEKRSIDHHLNARGWYLVNRSHFPSLPRHLFSANGGVEVGDSLLAFMAVKKALALREAPGRASREALASRMAQQERKPGEAPRVIMTGTPEAPGYYMPEAPPEVGQEPGEVPAETPPANVDFA